MIEEKGALQGLEGQSVPLEQKEEWYLFWLSNLPGIGLRTLQRLIRHFGNAESVSNASCHELERVAGLSAPCRDKILDREGRRRSQKSWMDLQKQEIHYISFFHEKYPKLLRNLCDAPKHLYVKGRLPDVSKCSVGIIGARECTMYGRDMARMFGYRLAEAGVQVISGMARGIDGWAHQGALESGGSTYAVLGCGVDICYPAVHRRLYDSICRQGGILSELPVGTTARAGFFPMRNRIISGLSDGILIVEAREKSGSLITADAALEQGRDVFVIPGRIGDELSVGCNRLIRQGAVPVLSPSDILDYYGISPQKVLDDGNMQSWEREILHMLAEQPVHMSELAQKTGVCQADLMRRLIKWKKEGRIREISRGYFSGS